MAMSSQPVAGAGVADRHHEEAEPKGQQDEIEHGLLLAKIDAARRCRRINMFQGTEVPLAA
jgi:hypothetical protein